MNLDGLWTADDGGAYYIQQLGNTVWWLGESDDGSFHKGLDFTNIFQGNLVDVGGGTFSIEGHWADVPRGATMNFGQLSMCIELDSDENPKWLHRIAETGGFSGSLWTFRTQDPNRTFPSLADLWGRITENTWHYDPLGQFTYRERLASSFDLVKDCVVVYGTLCCGQTFLDRPFVNTFPKWLSPGWQQFIDLNSSTPWATLGDGDMTGPVVVDPYHLPIGLLDGISDEHRQEVLDRINVVQAAMAMFAREVSGETPLLPGWAEQNGYSVLINGVPLNAIYDVYEQTVISMGPDNVVPERDNPVRVSGAMCLFNIKKDKFLAIHPVYAIDFITAQGRDDRSGVWGDQGTYTYYVHEVGNTLWMLVTAPFRDLSFVAVFQGVIQPDGATVAGSWSTVPIGTAYGFGEMTFQLGPGPMRMSAGGNSFLDGRVLNKLYDKAGHPCPAIGTLNVIVQGAELCDVKEIGGATVTYAVINPALATLQEIQYAWSTDTGQVAGSNSQPTVNVILPGAATDVTVTVVVSTATGCSYLGQRRFTTVTAERARQLQLWCQIRQHANAVISTMGSATMAAPAPGIQPEVPPAARRHELEESLARLLEMVHKLQKQSDSREEPGGIEQ